MSLPSSSSSSSSSAWNTKNLVPRLGVDVTSAACAAWLIAPLISIIDKSIMENASGRAPLAKSLKASLRSLLLRPHTTLFSKPVALIFLLYGGTYLSANAIDTASSTLQNRPADRVTSGGAKFAASSTANVSLCVYKDQRFAKMFGPPGATPRPVALPSYALFALRDCMTIFASFNVPPVLGPWLSDRVMGDKLQRIVAGATVAQFVAPAGIQLLSTPVHLLGLDLYNRPSSTAAAATAGARGTLTAEKRGPSWTDRWTQIRKTWAVSTVARVCRIVPAFGLGGMVNTKVRKSLMERLV